MITVVVGDYVCSESEVTALMEALSLFIDVGLGRLSSVGDVLLSQLIGRKDVSQTLIARLKSVQKAMEEVQQLLHNNTEKNSSFDPRKDPISVLTLKAMTVLCRTQGHPVPEEIDNWVRIQLNKNKGP